MKVYVLIDDDFLDKQRSIHSVGDPKASLDRNHYKGSSTPVLTRFPLKQLTIVIYQTAGGSHGPNFLATFCSLCIDTINKREKHLPYPLDVRCHIIAQLKQGKHSNGTAKVLVIGNSMAYRAFALIGKVFQGRYKELRLYSRSARPPLTDFDPPYTNATHIVVDKIRPDILWNIHVIYDKYVAPFDEKNKKNDQAYLEIERNLNYYKDRTKVLLIDLPFYWSNITVAYEMAKRLRQGKPIDDLKVPKEEMQKDQMYQRQRIRAVPCDKCVYLDIESRMIEDEFYWLYNRKNYHAYSKDGQHFTWDMLNRLEPIYQKAVDDALEKLNM